MGHETEQCRASRIMGLTPPTQRTQAHRHGQDGLDDLKLWRVPLPLLLPPTAAHAPDAVSHGGGVAGSVPSAGWNQSAGPLAPDSPPPVLRDPRVGRRTARQAMAWNCAADDGNLAGISNRKPNPRPLRVLSSHSRVGYEADAESVPGIGHLMTAPISIHVPESSLLTRSSFLYPL